MLCGSPETAQTNAEKRHIFPAFSFSLLGVVSSEVSVGSVPRPFFRCCGRLETATCMVGLCTSPQAFSFHSWKFPNVFIGFVTRQNDVSTSLPAVVAVLPLLLLFLLLWLMLSLQCMSPAYSRGMTVPSHAGTSKRQFGEICQAC